MSLYSAGPSSISGRSSATLLEKHSPHLPRYRRILTSTTLWCKHIVHYWWAWELMAGAISIAATATLILVLAQAELQTQWSLQIGSAQLTLNTVVAAISTVIRTSLMVTVAGPLNQSTWNWFSSPRQGPPQSGKPLEDLETFSNASIDSWSSLKLLWRTQGRNLASLGALVTILSLGFDTFAQQVLVFESLSVVNGEASSKAPIPRASSYIGKSSTIGVPPFDVSHAVLSSVINGNISLPDSTCSTGNCSWPTTPTLGVCSSCADVRSRLFRHGIQANETFASLNYSLPWTGTLFQPGQVPAQNTTITFEWLSGNDIIYDNVMVMESGNYFDLTPTDQLPIIQFFILGIPPKNLDTALPTWQFNFGTSSATELDPLLFAYNCSFNFCLQAFDAQTRAGVTKQRQLNTWEKMRPVETVAGYDEGGLWEFVDVPTDMNVANLSEYQVGSESLQALSSAFSGVFTGEDAYTDFLSGPAVSVSSGGFFKESSSEHDGDDGVLVIDRTFWNASDSVEMMSAFCQQIADGFTTLMRTSMPAPADVRYAPTVFIDKIFIRVRWQWLTYPLILLVTGHVFLIATIWQTRGRRTQPWKGHRIPLLLADVDDLVKQLSAGGLNSRIGLEDRVGRIKVRLEYDGQDEIAFNRVI